MLTIILLSFLVIGAGWYWAGQEGWLIQAANGLTVTWEDTPLFFVENMLPGDVEPKTFSILNGHPDAVEIGLRGLRIEEDPTDPMISEVLDVVIEEVGGSAIYGQGSLSGQKFLADFLAEFDGGSPLALTTLAPSASVDFKMTVTMPSWVGNDYQKTKVVFNLIIMVDNEPIPDLPPECQHLSGVISAVIEGTDERDVLRGTSASELILGKGEKDNIKGGGGDDCLVGGDGDDHINAGSGNDVLIGGEGNDDLDGHSDNDRIYGGNGDDLLKGKQGDDLFYGGAGNDKIEGHDGKDLIYCGNGNDEADGGADDDVIYGEEGNDKLKGASGNDQIFGGAGDDDLSGNSGDDHLIGDADTDKANGSSGTDTCDAETESSCEI